MFHARGEWKLSSRAGECVLINANISRDTFLLTNIHSFRWRGALPWRASRQPQDVAWPCLYCCTAARENCSLSRWSLFSSGKIAFWHVLISIIRIQLALSQRLSSQPTVSVHQYGRYVVFFTGQFSCQCSSRSSRVNHDESRKMGGM